MKRTPLKRKNSRMKNSSLRRKRKIAEEKIEEESLRMKNFFQGLWNKIPASLRHCWSCDKLLYEPVRSYYFDHLIEKSKKPELAYDEYNIFLCCLECHALKTDGHPTEVHQKAIEAAKRRFGLV